MRRHTSSDDSEMGGNDMNSSYGDLDQVAKKRHSVDYEMQVAELQSQPTAVVRGHASVNEIAGFLGSAFEEAMRVIESTGSGHAGPPFARYVPAGDGFDVEAGFPVARPLPTSQETGRAVASELPAGRVVRTLHVGGYDEVAAAYAALNEWVIDNGYAVNGAPWECYLDEPSVAEPRTMVYLPFVER